MMIIFNAKLHTFDPSRPSAEAIAIEGQRIKAVGCNDEINSAFTVDERLDAGGRCIIPGLADAHMHLEDYALGLQKVDCETATRQECLHRVAERVAITKPGEWIYGHGWNQNNWAEGYGNCALLDEIAPHNPVYLTHKSLHSGWANTLALQQVGITNTTRDPSAGRISHYSNGEPDGILFEAAMGLIEDALPAYNLDQVVGAMETALPQLNRMGLTCLHDFDRSQCLSALQVLHNQHKLRMRVIKGIPFENLSQAIELGLRSGLGDDLLRFGSVKLFADGALGPHTAAMLEPYDDEPANQGMLMLQADELFEQGRRAVDHGISLAVHAIGDRANRGILDGYAKLRDYERGLPSASSMKLRHRIEHVQVLHPDDLSHFQPLGIIASMQPIHATSDMLMADRSWGRRSAYAYAWRSLLDQHARLAFGSDAPVESPNPFLGIHSAVTRKRVDGSPSPQGWHPEQRLSVEEAVRGFTYGAAYAGGVEDRLGILAPGYLADLLILDQDLFTCDPDGIWNIQPVATMLGGEWVYSVL
jgi:predicted amidohydrolase YtcJ